MFQVTPLLGTVEEETANRRASLRSFSEVDGGTAVDLLGLMSESKVGLPEGGLTSSERESTIEVDDHFERVGNDEMGSSPRSERSVMREPTESNETVTIEAQCDGLVAQQTPEKRELPADMQSPTDQELQRILAKPAVPKLDLNSVHQPQQGVKKKVLTKIAAGKAFNKSLGVAQPVAARRKSSMVVNVAAPGPVLGTKSESIAKSPKFTSEGSPSVSPVPPSPAGDAPREVRRSTLSPLPKSPSPNRSESPSTLPQLKNFARSNTSANGVHSIANYSNARRHSEHPKNLSRSQMNPAAVMMGPYFSLPMKARASQSEGSNTVVPLSCMMSCGSSTEQVPLIIGQACPFNLSRNSDDFTIVCNNRANCQVESMISLSNSRPHEVIKRTLKLDELTIYIAFSTCDKNRFVRGTVEAFDVFGMHI